LLKPLLFTSVSTTCRYPLVYYTPLSRHTKPTTCYAIQRWGPCMGTRRLGFCSSSCCRPSVCARWILSPFKLSLPAQFGSELLAGVQNSRGIE